MGTSGSGLFAQIMYAEESPPGVPVTPTVGLPFVNESLDGNIARIEDDSIIAGRAVLDSSQWAPGNVQVGGDVGHKLYPNGAGLLLKYLFGSQWVTTGVGPYTHTGTPVAGAFRGKALTAQKGVPGVLGGVHPFTVTGAKVASAVFACKAGEFATYAMTLVGMNFQMGSRVVTDGVTTSGSSTISSTTAVFGPADNDKTITSLAAAIPVGTKLKYLTATTAQLVSAATNLPVNATATTAANTFTIGMPLATIAYPSPLPIPFTYRQGTVNIAGTPSFVKDITFTFDNQLDDSRRGMGSPTIKEALEKDLRSFTGQIAMEFEDTTQFDRFVGGTEFALVLAFTSGTSSLTITANIRYDGDTPKVGDRGLVDQPLPFKVVAPGVDSSGISLVLVNGDATP